MKEFVFMDKNKNTKVRLGPNLTLKEFQCRCDLSECSRTLINFKSVRSFDKTRYDFGFQVRVTSGFRCQIHNRDVGGLPKSFHLIGSALDLTPVSNRDGALDRLESYALKYFDVVVRYDTFIHCHNKS